MLKIQIPTLGVYSLLGFFFYHEGSFFFFPGWGAEISFRLDQWHRGMHVWGNVNMI